MYQVSATERFKKELKKLLRKYPRFEEDVSRLIQSLSISPESGNHLGNGIFKVRVAITGKPSGKSYGARVIHVVFSFTKRVYLLTVYDKSEKQDLSPTELKELVLISKSLKRK